MSQSGRNVLKNDRIQQGGVRETGVVLKARMRRFLAILALLGAASSAAAAAPSDIRPAGGPGGGPGGGGPGRNQRRNAPALPADPATMDPEALPPDDEFGPRLSPVVVQSSGSSLFGVIYVAAGKGPHPTAVFLHGYPGHEENADLAQAARRAGWNVVMFHYRGTWGSEGSFSIPAAMEDVAAVLETLRSHLALLNWRVDRTRIALVGHSMGGFLALMDGARDPGVECIAALSPVNLGQRGKELAANPEGAAAFASRLKGDAGLVKGASPAETVQHFIDKKDEYDLPILAGPLSGKTLLLVGGSRDGMAPPDKHLDPLVKALREKGASRLTVQTLDADHTASGQRIALARLLVSWLNDKCLAPKPPPPSAPPAAAPAAPDPSAPVPPSRN